MLEAEYLLCIDSDGQCDPKDFWSFWEARGKCDLALGWRVRRADPFVRRAFSGFFHVLYRMVLGVPVRDPSCPYVLAPRRVVAEMVDRLGLMQQGFWWEFVALVSRGGYVILEAPVNHRSRAAGETQVYKWARMPGIFFRHLAALFEIRRRAGDSRRASEARGGS
jgi:hypothetical protein